MLPPAAMSFSALVATTGFLFVIWHTWHYDRWRCMIYTKHDWFRALMCQVLLASVAAFMAYTWIELHILYDEYYVFIGGETIPAPWQLWSKRNQNLWRASLYVLCSGWCFLQAVHLEEFLYWGYLIHGIRTTGGPRWSWINSPFFKVWVVASACSWALLFGASHIETSNLDMMKTYLFIVGSSVSCVLAIASIVLCCIFPRFVESVKRQGANFEVLERLHFFAEMNQIRAFFRCIYAIAFLILSADGLTNAKRINKSGFWSDILYLCGHLAIFVSACLSVVVLLPRNMTSESLPNKSDTNIHPMVAYKRPLPPTADGFSPRQYYELGNRLNIDREALGTGLSEPNSAGFEMRDSPTRGGGGKQQGWELQKEVEDGSSTRSGTDGSGGVPFALAADTTRRARMSQMPSLPAVMARFKSPFETASPTERTGPGYPTQVYVTTSQTVHHSP